MRITTASFRDIALISTEPTERPECWGVELVCPASPMALGRPTGGLSDSAERIPPGSRIGHPQRPDVLIDAAMAVHVAEHQFRTVRYTLDDDGKYHHDPTTRSTHESSGTKRRPSNELDYRLVELSLMSAAQITVLTARRDSVALAVSSTRLPTPPLLAFHEHTTTIQPSLSFQVAVQ
jgi:hypothetical protein